MPEGDTIYRAAARMRPALVGRSVRDLRIHRVPKPRLPQEPTVTAVDSVGKHLLIRFDSGHILDSHLLMNGAWYVHPLGARWERSPGALRALVATDEVEAVLFSTPAVALRHERSSDKPWEKLGPDLCRPDVDIGEAVRRVRWLPSDTAIADALLDQRPACGIGNVYKSEVLWAERVHPRTRLELLTDVDLHRLYATAARLLQANLERSKRVTFRAGLAVYGRYPGACPRCAARIERWGQGDLDRVTFACPSCQPVSSV